MRCYFYPRLGKVKKKEKTVTPCVTAFVQDCTVRELMGQSLHGTGNCAVDPFHLSCSNEHSTRGQSSEHTE